MRLNIGHNNVVLLLLTVFLGACTTVPVDQSAGQPDTSVPELAKPSTKPDAAPLRTEPVRPRIELTEEILYKLLVAEFAGQRGMLDVSVENYLELAYSTRDPKVVERATRIAVFARDNSAATEAATLWAELDPNNPDPHQVLAVMAVRAGKSDQALKHLEVIMQAASGKPDQKLWMIANFLGREQDQNVVMDVMERLMKNYMNDANAIFAFAQVAARLGETKRSRELLERVLELQPDNDNAAMSYITLLQRDGNTADAISWIESVLDSKENDFTLRHAYARLLTDAKRFDEARRQFEILSVQAPNNTEVLYALGLLYLQVNRLDQANTYFQRLSDRKKKVNEANYYLGRIAEEKDEMDQAITWYQGVQGGENYFDARIRLSLILARQGDIGTALNHVRNIQTRKFEDKIVVIQAEAEILTEVKRYDEALNVFNTAIAEKSHPDLLYSRAMLAEKMNRFDILEEDLRAILQDEPDNAQALNALGYSLADKTNRYEEAYELIQKALELSPDDFYILDSMGWVLYRLGRFDEAVIRLRKALALRGDPEIAAHLGEVLWVMGDKHEAKQIWETALKDTPKDDRLLEVIRRFNP